MSIHLLSRSDSDLSRETTPLCVIGGGIAGTLLAYRLAKQGRRVTVIESGHTSFDPAIHQLNEIVDPAGRYRRELDGRYRGLGGSSTRWGGRMIPVGEHERGERPHVAQPAWPLPAAEIDRYEHEIEKLFRIDEGPYEDGEGAASPDANGYFYKDPTDIVTRWAKCPSFKLCNVNALLGRELEQLPNLTIWLDATVCGFDLAAGRLRGITARSLNGRTLEVKADEFVLAAGTIETTRLLLAMDAASNGHAFANCDALGRYFQDHLKAKVATIDRGHATFTNKLFAYRFVNATRRDLHLELSQAAQHKDGVASAFAYIAMDMAQSPLKELRQVMRNIQRRELEARDLLRVTSDLGLLMRSAWWRLIRQQVYAPDNVDFDLMVCAEQLPDAANRIRLADTKDRFGMPQALFEWRPMPSEERTFRSAVTHLEAYWKKAGFDRLCALRLTPAARNPSIPIIEGAEACAHPSGSARMGTDKTQSVVGPDLRCHAIPNLAVASAAVFPTAGSANPTFTIMKLALWLADTYREPRAMAA